MVAYERTRVHFQDVAPDPFSPDGMRGRGASTEATRRAARTEVVG